MTARAAPQTLVVADLAVSRGERPLFRGLGFRLEPGRALILRGPNGSGKSTLLRALLGLAGSDSGRLTIGETASEPRAGALRGQAVYLGHATGMKAELPARRALAFAAELDGSPQAEPAIEAALARFGLGRRGALPCRQLSQGQRQRLALARLALADAAPSPRPFWLLDEPQTALDSDGLELFDALLGAHLARGGSALVAAHGPVATDLAGTATLDLAPFSARRRAAAVGAGAGDDHGVDR